MIRPFSSADMKNYETFCNHIQICQSELYARPQICKQHFYIAMGSLHAMENKTPEMKPIVQYIGRDFEDKLNDEHKRAGFHMATRY